MKHEKTKKEPKRPLEVARRKLKPTASSIKPKTEKCTTTRPAA